MENEKKPISKDESVEAMELSFFKTLYYLKTRYEVLEHYNRRANSERSIQYKVRNNQKEIMRVNYNQSTFSQYISIETEPEYFDAMNVEFAGFTHVQTRASHPRQRMVYENYEAIKKSLAAMCDAIDIYFGAASPEQFQTVYKKLSQKLHSISKDYRDSSGISVTKILSLLGENADRQLVTEILDNADWAWKVSEDAYSFSGKTADVITEASFKKYILDDLRMSESTWRRHVLSIRAAEEFAQDYGLSPYKIFDCPISEAVEVINTLRKNLTFQNFNLYEHNRYFAAFNKFVDCAARLEV